MKVLIACEESQTVCKEFRNLGHQAFSCDLQKCSGGHPEWHIQDDALKVLQGNNWNLVIAHPPCTYLANSGSKHLYVDGRKENGKNVDRWAKMRRAAKFFRSFLDYDKCPIAIENSIIHKHAAKIIGRRQDQLIQPWMFGHGETKATCFWLKGLPKLKPTDIVEGREQRIHKMPPGENRSKERSKTYPGIARAMAKQWSDYLRQKSLFD